jgi:hypothetical protein
MLFRTHRPAGRLRPPKSVKVVVIKQHTLATLFGTAITPKKSADDYHFGFTGGADRFQMRASAARYRLSLGVPESDWFFLKEWGST